MHANPLSTGPSTRTRRLLATAASIGAAVVLTAAMAQASDGMVTPAPAATPVTADASATGAPSLALSTDRAQRRGWSFRTVDDSADPAFNQLLGITNHGRIVGYFGSGADAAHPNKGFVVRSPYGQNNFRNENFPGSAQTQVVGINNNNVTVGFFVDAADANVGFVERGGRFTAVSNPATATAAPFNQLLGVNDYGVAVGFFNDAAGAAHGYTFDTRDGSFADVVLPVAADSVTATGIADDGTVSGFFTMNKATSGFVLRHGAFRQLSFGAGSNTQALGINDRHQVVGSYVDTAGRTHGFLWSAGHGMTRVDDPNSTTSTVVNGLNNRGQLVGFYLDAAGNTHGFLAAPRS
jgi:probable HAF family extracellular repeat protein